MANTLACSSRGPADGVVPPVDGGPDTSETNVVTTDETDTTTPVDTTSETDTTSVANTTSDDTATVGETDAGTGTESIDTSVGTTSDDTETTGLTDTSQPDPTGTDTTGTDATSETTDGTTASEATETTGTGVPDAGPDAASTGTSDDPTDVTDTSDETTTGDTTTDDGLPALIGVSEFDTIQGFGGSTNINGHTPTITLGDSIGEFEVPFTGGNYQQSSWNFMFTAPPDGLCGYNLVARVRLDSGFNAVGAANGGVQLRAWSDGVWTGNLQNWTNLDAATHTGVWRDYVLDLDAEGDVDTTFDPATLHAVGIAFISGGAAEAEYSTATFSIDWVRFEEKVPGEGGCFTDAGDAGVDSGTDVSDGGSSSELDSGVVDTTSADTSATTSADTDAGMVDPDTGVVDTDAGMSDEDSGVIDTDTGMDAAVVDNGATDPPLNALLVLTDFATSGSKTENTPLGPGYAPEQGSLVAGSDYVIANSVATFTTPFTTTGQNYGAAFETNGLDVTGHELQVRLRIVNPFITGTAVQLTTWSSDGVGEDYNFDGFWSNVSEVGYADWTVYVADLDVDTTYPGSLTMAGFQLDSGYNGGGTVYSTVEFEVDWVAIVPKL